MSPPSPPPKKRESPHLEDGLEEVRIVHDLAVVCILVVHLHALTLHQPSHYYHKVQGTKFENKDLNFKRFDQSMQSFSISEQKPEDNDLTVLIIIENTVQASHKYNNNGTN